MRYPMVNFKGFPDPQIEIAKSVDSVEVLDGVVIDYDSMGKITGIDIEDASKILDLEECVMGDLPVQKQVAPA